MRPTEMEFFKMSAAGNDFILFDNRSGDLPIDRMEEFVRRVCSRAVSVGSDGVVLIENSTRADVRARFFNPDGRPTFCCNGGCCAARIAYLKGLAPARLTVETDLMLHRAEVRGTSVIFEMGDPQDLEQVAVEVDGRTIRGTRVDTGVPHFVVVQSVEPRDPIEPLGRALRSHERFAPSGVNVDFIWPADEGCLGMRTYERGVEAETLACGTGAVAAAVAAAVAGTARSPVRLRTRSGALLQVSFEGDPRRATGVRVEGEVRLVYVGQLTEEAMQGHAP